MNKAILIGNLSKDPELTTTQNGVSVARFTLAVQRKYANQDGTKEADFLNCVAWRTTAENLTKYCKKGDKISVIGRVETRKYEAQDGTKRYVTEIIADEIEFVNTKKAGQPAEQPAEPQPELTPVDDPDGLPF